MEFYRKYLEEVEKKQLYLTNEGFVVYKMINDHNLFIDVCWVTPEERKGTAAITMVCKVLDKLGTTNLNILCEVDEMTPYRTKLLSHYFDMGFKLHEMHEDKVTLWMDEEYVKINYNKYLHNIRRCSNG